MNGYIRKRNNKWYYSYSIITEDGKRKNIERAGGNTRKEAEKALNDALHKYYNGYVEPKKMTVDEYFTDWIENYIKENRKLNTYNRYKEIYKNNIQKHIGKLLLKDLKAINVDKLLTSEKKKGLSSSTLQAIYGVINSALNRAVKLQMLNDNICKFVDRPKREKFVANTLSLEEFKLLLDNLNENLYGDKIFKLALNTIMELGLRRGELGGLEWKDIDFNNNLINIKNNLVYTNNAVILGSTKTDESQRTLSISNYLIALLKKHKVEQNSYKLELGKLYEKNIFNKQQYDFVFTWQNGKYVHPNWYTLKFNRLIKKLGINKRVRFHDLRHTNATLLLQQGVDFKVIQTRLGHSNISTTMNIYSHVTTKMQRNATEKISDLLKNIE